jgi:hypothetical protein
MLRRLYEIIVVVEKQCVTYFSGYVCVCVCVCAQARVCDCTRDTLVIQHANHRHIVI